MNGGPHPRETAMLLGQEKAEARLLAALGSGRLPHGWLLTGKAGIGKATLAYRIARFLLARPDARPGLTGDLAIDPDDPVFRQVAAGAHPDLIVLEPGVNEKTGKPRSEIPVEEVRTAAQALRRTASAGGWRLLIVDPADRLSRSAANALLKLLEEPPPKALLLLVSHGPAGLLPTIRSRCARLSLPPLPETLLNRLLALHLPELSAEERQQLAVLAEGSLGQALALQEAGGLDLYRRILAVLNRAGEGLDVAEAHAFADELARGGGPERHRTAFDLLIWWLARMVRAGAGRRLPVPLIAEEDGLAERLLARRTLADWVHLWEKLSTLARECERANLDRKQALLTALIELEAAG